MRGIVEEAAARLGLEPPEVEFVAAAAVVRWDETRGLRVPIRTMAHYDRFGNVPTDAARDIALALAKKAAGRSGETDATLIEIEALSFAEAFVRDRVLNR